MPHPKVSICIPAYEMHGRGAEFLEQLFESLRQQTLQDFEVILSDHSQDSVIREICQKWNNTLPISYLHFTVQRGNASANLNNALNVASGEIIKPMHQDDFFFSPTALQQIVDTVIHNLDFVWGASGFVHTNEKCSHFYRYQTPFYRPNTPLTANTIGAPSVWFFRNHKNIRFDEHLIWMNDAELAYRLNRQFGPPFILETTLVVNRQWSHQVTHTLARRTVRLNEIRYTLTKHHSWFITAGLLFRRIGGRLTSIAKSSFADLSSRISALSPKSRQEDLLSQLANKYRTDKGTRKMFAWEGVRHFYTPVYSQYLSGLRFRRLIVLEIGIGSGASLKVWYRYLPNSKIYALDVRSFHHLNNDRVTCLAADQSNRDDLKKVMEIIGEPVDIIIDDGGHYMHQQQISFGFLFAYMRSGGLYFIEDLHTSYWPYNGHNSVYGHMPIDTNKDKSNSTLNMVKNYLAQGRIMSPYLTPTETAYLTQHIVKCAVHDTTVNTYGPNHLAVFLKR